ncbi:uncharacterized protein B0J16DRAFT_123911 [Fusarium flagelliforme]|uniref:uncharacterized protein n=1 Tax=Fusarium flagelliforme TaxID=2675880 RepID=UPI001E8CDF11|nr:uncharacterized protein B0J16DRAFT_123911 [Fusarium flagelliforme]KAH7185009.1 hypothetical protein B0J16DRAFT_123911 [Fusarium flagelliforme]
MNRTIFTKGLRAAAPRRPIHTPSPRALSNTTKPEPQSQATTQTQSKQQESTTTKDTTKMAPHKKKTMAQLDQELREKLEGLSGEGGGAGVEYEGGKAEGLKRGVKSNMFRVI